MRGAGEKASLYVVDLHLLSPSFTWLFRLAGSEDGVCIGHERRVVADILTYYYLISPIITGIFCGAQKDGTRSGSSFCKVGGPAAAKAYIADAVMCEGVSCTNQNGKEKCYDAESEQSGYLGRPVG
jgi:hypothetical protein